MKKRFSIRYKLISIFAVSIITLIFFIITIIGFQIRKTDREQFHKNMQQNISLIEYDINSFFDNTKYMLRMLSNHTAVRNVDTSLNEYISKTGISNIDTIEKSATEAAVFNLFKNIHKSYPYYMCVFMGTKWGGYTSTCDMALPGGYDPRKRPWYEAASRTPKKPVVTEAYQSTAGDSVICLSQGVFSFQNEHIGNVSIEVSLGTLTEMLKTLAIGKTGYIMLVQGDGTILADPKNDSFNFKKIEDINVPAFTQFTTVNSGSMSVKIDNKKWLAELYTIDSLNWKLIALMQEDEVFSEFYRILRSILIIGFILLIIFLIISLTFVLHITKALD